MSYLIKVGLLCYGTLFFFIWTFLPSFLDNNYTFDFLNTRQFNILLVIFGIVSPLFGILLIFDGII